MTQSNLEYIENASTLEELANNAHYLCVLLGHNAEDILAGNNVEKFEDLPGLAEFVEYLNEQA